MSQKLSTLSDELVLVQFQAADKWDLINKMVDVLMQSDAFPEELKPDDATDSASPYTREAIAKAVIEREKDHSTGLGHGIAFPHARIPRFPGIRLCIAIMESDSAIDFGSPDGVPADIICLMLVSEAQPHLALKVMAQFARMMNDPVNQSFLRKEKDRRKLSDFIGKRVLKFDDAITATDIMRASLVDIYPDTPLQEVTQHMLQHSVDAISVVDEDGLLVGEITSENLFKIGMPDFFTQLKSVAFISEFDPFEKYFEAERKTVAKDVMRNDYAALPETATLLEVVFELAVKRHSKVYVVHEGRRIGVIDRMLVLDRVINI